MIDPSLAFIAERIENFLRKSSWAVGYAPLPANTYHMTIYSIYQCGNRMIPPVERWVNETGVAVSKNFWLPDDVLQKQNDKAMCIIDKYLKEPLHIRRVSLVVHERGIKLVLNVEEDSLVRIRNARNEFAIIYEDLDLSLEPIDKRLHIGLAYVYATKRIPTIEERNQLSEIVQTFNGGSFVLPTVYLFDSMTNYIPYSRKHLVEC